jgi:hypothetical protein
MTITDGYATVKDIKRLLDPKSSATFTLEDEINLETAIEAASRWIDSETGTHYYSNTETRYYTPVYGDILYVDDFLSVTTLKSDDDWDGTYETTWTTSDYILEPRNAAANSNDIKPYRRIRVDVNGDYVFPVGVRDGVELAGSFGYSSATPANIKAACALLAHRTWLRHRAIFGIAGTPQNNVMVVQAKIQRDTDIMEMLKPVNLKVQRA